MHMRRTVDSYLKFFNIEISAFASFHWAVNNYLWLLRHRDYIIRIVYQ